MVTKFISLDGMLETEISLQFSTNFPQMNSVPKSLKAYLISPIKLKMA